jgi:hypothetical protein
MGIRKREDNPPSQIAGRYHFCVYEVTVLLLLLQYTFSSSCHLAVLRMLLI